MATKHDSICLEKAGDDEPIFVLRGQDVTSTATIRFWLKMNPQLSPAKVSDAFNVIKAMENWPRRKNPD